MIRAVMGRGELSNANHLMVLRKEMHDVQKNRDDANEVKLKVLFWDIIGTG